jgi:hypothetical protein
MSEDELDRLLENACVDALGELGDLARTLPTELRQEFWEEMAGECEIQARRKRG